MGLTETGTVAGDCDVTTSCPTVVSGRSLARLAGGSRFSISRRWFSLGLTSFDDDDVTLEISLDELDKLSAYKIIDRMSD